MSLDASKRPSRRGSNPDLWPKWMWIAVPVLVVVVVAALWWAIFAEPGTTTPAPTPTPTQKVIPTQPAEKPTPQQTVESLPASETRPVLPTAPTLTSTPIAPSTPTSSGVEGSSGAKYVPGDKVQVKGTGGAGLNMRAQPGTDKPRIKTLPEGAVIEILGGPSVANNMDWYQVRDQANAEGWVADTYLSAAK